MSSATVKVESRSGTRVPCEIPIILTTLDSPDLFYQACHVILANPRGCAVRCCRPAKAGAAVWLKGLPVAANVTGRIVHCISFGEHTEFWLLGVKLDEPGNVWGIATPPEDWRL